MPIEVILSLVTLAGAAAVALVCDFLRARNSQLRRTVARMKAAQADPGQTSGPGARPDRAVPKFNPSTKAASS